MATLFNIGELEGFSRKQMQALAKKYGIKANTKNDVMRQALHDYHVEKSGPETEDVTAPLSDITNDKTSPVAVVTPAKVTPSVAMSTPETTVDDSGIMEEKMESLTADSLVDGITTAMRSVDIKEDDKEQLDNLVNAMHFLSWTRHGKVHCALTNHDMKAEISTVVKHMKGKTFERIRKEDLLDISAYYPYFIETANPDEVYCTVTEATVKATFDDIERHMEGKLYMDLKKKYRGLPTPKGKRTFFNTPAKRDYEEFNVHWTMDQYDEE